MEGEMLIRVSTISASRGGFGPILTYFEVFLSSFLAFGPVFNPQRGEMLIHVSTISAPRGGLGPILTFSWGLFEVISGFWACFEALLSSFHVFGLVFDPHRGENVNTCIHDFRTSRGIWAYFEAFLSSFLAFGPALRPFWAHFLFLGLFLTPTEEKC